MKTLCHLILALFTGSALHAQTLSFGDDTVKVNGYADAYEIISYGTLYNNTSNNVEVTWLRVVNDIPGEWLSQVCDNNVCWPESASTPGAIVNIPGNGSSNFDVHFRASDVPGNGTVLMRAWVIGDSANTVVSGVYKATALYPVSVKDKVGKNNINNILIYPNPAKDYVMVKNLPLNEVSTVEIYNIFGRKMLSFSQPPMANGVAHKFDLTVLPKGVYMIRVFDGDMNVIHTMSLSKE